MQAYWNALSGNITFLLFLLPILGAGLVAVSSGLGIFAVRRIALVNVLLTLCLTALLVAGYDQQRAADREAPEPIQMVSSLRWLGEVQTNPDSQNQVDDRGDERAEQEIIGPDIRLAVGVDGLSLWLIVLTAVLMLPAVLAGRDVDRKQPAAFYALLLLLEASIIGLFAALDVVLFAVCLEACAVLLFFLIGGWGGYERRRVVRKFLVCNLCGSLLILLGLLGLVVAHSWMTGSFSSPTVASLTFSIPRLVREIPLAILHDSAAEAYWRHVSSWIFLSFLVGFAVKMPVVPFHTWMPETHNEAPAAISLLFVGVVLKVGGYGFLRIVLPLFPDILAEASGFLLTMAVCGVVYAGLLTLGQDDVKKVITYGGLAQLGCCAAAIVSLNSAGVSGALLQLISHGLAAGGLLFLVGVLDRHYQTRDIEAFSGLARKYPALAFFLAFFALSLVGIPGLGGFPGEWLSLMGLFQSSPGGMFAALAGMLLVVWALVWMLQRILLGTLREPRTSSGFVVNADEPAAAVAPSTSSERRNAVPRDLLTRELLALVPVGVMLLCIGLCPNFFLSRMEPSVSFVLDEDYRETPADESSRTMKYERNNAANEREFPTGELAARIRRPFLGAEPDVPH